MPSQVDLVLRVLADVSGAQTSFQGLAGNVAKLAGVGALGGVAAAGVDSSMKLESAMARVQVAMNSVDFKPGTAAFAAAKDQILKDSVTLATSAEDVAAVYAQASRYVDQFGNKLPTDKLNEMTDVVIRLGKVSTDQLAPEAIGQYLDVFSKLNDSTDFNRIGNEVAQLAQSHNQGEGLTFDTAIPIAQYGAGMGVTPEESLGTATYLVDRMAGGNQAGASLGRMFMRMDQSADDLLDPAVNAGKAKKSRDAQEHIDDLQTSLAVAQQRQDQMFGQHGLKTAYQKDPAALMESEDRIAKLNREIADSKADQLTDASIAAKTPKGAMNVAEMARIAGIDPTAFANQVKSDPMQALQQYTAAVGALPEQERGAAFRAAGISNVRDLKTASVLASQPDVLARYIAEAQTAGDSGTALQGMSGTVLDTTASKMTDATNAASDAAALAFDPLRTKLDDGLTSLLSGVQTSGFGPLEDKLQLFDTNLGSAADAALGFAQQLGPAGALQLALFGGGLLKGAAGLFGGGGATAAAGGTGEAGAAVAGGGSLLLGGAGALAAGGVAFLQVQQMQQSWDAYNNARQAAGQQPISVNFGDIVQQPGQSVEQMADHVKNQLISAWNQAMTTTPVSGTVGGNIGAPTTAR